MGNPYGGLNARTSTAAKDRAGTRRPDREARTASPQAPAGRPAMPALEGAAAAAWAAVVGACEALGVLSAVDGAALEQYARLAGETVAIAERQAGTRAAMVALEAGLAALTGPELLAAFGQITACRRLEMRCTDQLRQGRTALRQFLGEFGLTPASRGRIRVAAAAEAVDPFDAMQKGRRGLRAVGK